MVTQGISCWIFIGPQWDKPVSPEGIHKNEAFLYQSVLMIVFLLISKTSSRCPPRLRLPTACPPSLSRKRTSRSSSWDRSFTSWRTTSATTASAPTRTSPVGRSPPRSPRSGGARYRGTPSPVKSPPDRHPDRAAWRPDLRRGRSNRLRLWR